MTVNVTADDTLIAVTIRLPIFEEKKKKHKKQKQKTKAKIKIH